MKIPSFLAISVAATYFFSIGVSSHASTVFFLGDDEDGGGFQDELDQESGQPDDDDYYVENGDFTGLTPTATLWTGGMEVLRDGVTGNEFGLPRAVTTGATSFHILFNLDVVEADPAAELTFNTDLCLARADTTSEVSFSMNGTVFHVEPATGPGGVDQVPVSVTFDPLTVGAVIGPNVITVERTGGDDGPEAFAWIQFDYYNLEADTSGVACPDPICSFSTAAPSIDPGSSVNLSWVASSSATLTIDDGSGPVDVTADSTLGQGSRSFTPVANTTYILSSTGPAGTDTAMLEVEVRNIFSFSTDLSQLLSGETATLSWAVDPAASVTITADNGTSPGNVDAITVAGAGSIGVTPNTVTTYTLTSTRVADVETAQVIVSGSQFESLWMIGVEDDSAAELEQETAGMELYYYEDGDYTGLTPPGVLWSGGMETWQDDPGPPANGDPGFPRALTTGFTDINIFFQLNEAEAAADAFLNAYLDVHVIRSVGGVDSTHDIDLLFNNNVVHSVAANTTEPIQATFSAIDAGANVGSNVFTLRRTGGTTGFPDGTDLPGAAWIVFDYIEMASIPGAVDAFEIVDITSDGNTTTTFTWNSKVGSTYIIERSSDLENWIEITDGFPSGGATAPQTSFTDTDDTPLNNTHFFRVREE